MSKNILEASLEGVEHIVLLGHIHPDGDCIGTTLGLLNYLRENYPQIEAELFLDHPAAKFSYMNDFEKKLPLTVVYTGTKRLSTDTEHHSKINQHIEKLAKELNDPYLLQVAKEYDFGSDNVSSGQGTIAFNLVTYLSSGATEYQVN